MAYDADYSVAQTPVVTLDTATSGSGWGEFFTGAGGLLTEYARARIIRSGDTMGRDGQQQDAPSGSAAMPAWLLPVAVLGGLGLVVLLVLRK